MEARSTVIEEAPLVVPLPAVLEGTELFPLAVNCVFNRFTVLKMAVENEFGGIESSEKAEWLYEVLLEYFESRTDTIYVDELELWLEDIFENEFNVEMEEEHIFKDVSVVLLELHRQLANGKTDEVIEFIRRTQKFVKPAFNFYKDPQTRAAMVAESPAAMDIDNSADQMSGMSLDMDSQPKVQQPTVDADGWETVTKKGKHKN